MTAPFIVVRQVPMIAARLVEQRERDVSTMRRFRDAVPLPSSAKGDHDAAIESNSALDVEREATTKFTPGASPDDIDLDELMATLKALAAKAQQLPPSRRNNKHLAVIVAAIVLSTTSGAVTAQYLIPGHSHAPAAPSKSFAAATPSVATPIGHDGR